MSSASKKTKAVLIDWDGTVRPGFTLLEWTDFLHQHGVIDITSFRYIARKFEAYKKGKLEHDELCLTTAHMYARAIQGKSVESVTILADEFVLVDCISLYPFAAPLFAMFRDCQWLLIAITGAPREVVQRHASDMGIQRVFGLTVAVNSSGTYCGTVLENPGLTTSKTELVGKLSMEFDIELAIGNSCADYPMLASARMGILIVEETKGSTELQSGNILLLKPNDLLNHMDQIISRGNC